MASQARVKQVCRTWKQIASDSRLIPHEKILRENIEKLRPVLNCGPHCQEDHWITLWLNDKGEVLGLPNSNLGLDSHTKNSSKSLDVMGLHALELHFHAEDWDPAKGPAFYVSQTNLVSQTPVKLLLDELNRVAQAAWAKTKETTYTKKEGYYQEWFSVMINPNQYPTTQLLASSDLQGDLRE